MTVTRPIIYTHDSLVLEGFLAEPALANPAPGIVVFPEWHGVSDHARRRAAMLAELGYVAFVADMYGKDIRPTEYDDCAKESGKYRSDRLLMRMRAHAALSCLQALPSVDAMRLAAVGYCFGGTVALELASDGADLKATIAFHANLDTPTPEDAKQISGSVLVLHGADDPVVPDAEVAEFQQRMRSAGVDWQFFSYGNTVHSFTNFNLPSTRGRPAAYSELSDHRSWAAMRELLNETLR